MSGVVVALLLVWLVATVVGTLVAGWFWLTVVALGGVAFMGAILMSMRLVPEEAPSPQVDREEADVLAIGRVPTRGPSPVRR